MFSFPPYFPRINRSKKLEAFPLIEALNRSISPALIEAHITIATTGTKSIERKQTTCALKISDTKTCPKQKLKTITVHFQNPKNLLL